MRKIYLLLASCVMLASANANAQCTGQIPGRYQQDIFPNVTITDGVTYSSVYSQKMDVYEPTGDTNTSRPLVILAHGGSFIGGDRKADATVDSLCLRFARRGYVTVSIDYRLGASILSMIDSNSAADVVCKAISDGKACIRYMVQHRTTYKIDTNNIFIGGNSAGAVLYMHVGYIENLASCSPLILNALNANGGFEGNSGNPGYTTKAKGVINLAGALNNTDIIQMDGISSVNLQGDLDGTVPYNCGKPLGGLSQAQLCGLGALEPVYNAKSVYHLSKVFPAQDHVPWMNTDAAGQAMAYTLDSLVTVFMYNMICNPAVVGVNNVKTATEVNVFPNPASDMVNLRCTETLSAVTVYDQMGRVVADVNGISKTSYELNTSHLSKGVYLIKIKFDNENNAPVTRRVVIQ